MNVVVTGASRGIGRSIAEHFAAEGAHLFLCSRNMDASATWQQELMDKYQINITAFNADLGKESDVKNFGNQIEWLINDLEKANKNRNKIPWIIVYGHRPMYDKNIVDWPFLTKYNIRKVFEPIFIKYNVNVYIAGGKRTIYTKCISR